MNERLDKPPEPGDAVCGAVNWSGAIGGLRVLAP
jgi:hypothetical protein